MIKICLNEFNIVLKESIKCIQNGGKLMFFGNGGSSVDACHIATELSVRFSRNRKALPAISLSADVSCITACANDFGLKYIFSRQIEAIGKKNDIAFCISTSGNSENVLHATKACQEIGIKTIAFTGNSGKLASLTDFCISIPSSHACFIQEGYMWVGHSLCDAIEEKFA